MPRPRRMFSMLFALTAALAHAPGHARIASADAQLSGFTYRLSDLDPNDGITPSISIAPYHAGGGYYLSSSMVGNSQVFEFIPRGDTGTTRHANAFGGAATSTGTAFLSASAHYGIATAQYAQFEGNNEYKFRFTLSPNTRIEFLADVSLKAFDPGGPVQASARLDIMGWLDALAPPAYEQFGVRRTVEDGGYAGQFHGELRTDADATPGYFLIIQAANVTVNAVPPPVPEPSAYAMLVAGLVLAGAGARRRRSGNA